MSQPVTVEPFEKLAASLNRSGNTAYGQMLDQALGSTCTTSSELISRIGEVVVEIHLECDALDREQRSLVRQCIKEVRKAFPGYALFQMLPLTGRWFARKVRRRNNTTGNR